MPSDPIARWESEGGSILAIERLRPAAKVKRATAHG